jgi:hypothetical protein
MVAVRPIGQISVAVFLGSMSFPPKAPSDKTPPYRLGETIMKVVAVGSGPIGGAVAKMDDGTCQAIDQLVRTRRSIRRFTNRPVSKKLLRELLDVAGRAPSNSNMQPWRVYMVGGAARDRLAHALSEARKISGRLPARAADVRSGSARPVFRSAAAIWTGILWCTWHRPGRHGRARPAGSAKPHFL